MAPKTRAEMVEAGRALSARGFPAGVMAVGDRLLIVPIHLRSWKDEHAIVCPI